MAGLCSLTMRGREKSPAPGKVITHLTGGGLKLGVGGWGGGEVAFVPLQAQIPDNERVFILPHLVEAGTRERPYLSLPPTCEHSRSLWYLVRGPAWG